MQLIILNILNIICNKNTENIIKSPIQTKFLEFKIEETILLIKETKKFDIKDLPYVYFINKYFNKNTSYGKYLVGCNLNHILTLIGIQQYESDESTIFINKSDLINSSIEECKKIVYEFLEKKRIFKPKLKLEDLNKKIDIESLEQLALSGTKEGIKNLIKYLNKNLHIAYKSEKVLQKIKTSSSYGILGQIYLYGINVNKNISLAKHYFKLGATQGDINCLNGLGDFYNKIEKKPSKALTYYIVSTKKGSKEGSYKLKKLLINFFNNSTEILNDDSEGIYLPELLEELKKDIEIRNYDDACKKIKKILNYSKEIQEIEELIQKYYLKKEYHKSFLLTLFLQECGSETALIDLNYLFLKIKNSFKLPFKYFEIKNNIILSKEKLNELYFNVMNQYITKDSRIPISMCYLKGIGIPINEEMAFAHLEIAKMKSNIYEASVKILNAYEFGIGVPLNLKNAILELEFIEKNVSNSKLFCFYKKLILNLKLILHNLKNKFPISISLIYLIIILINYF